MCCARFSLSAVCVVLRWALTFSTSIGVVSNAFSLLLLLLLPTLVGTNPSFQKEEEEEARLSFVCK
jgi:hypothetical protein